MKFSIRDLLLVTVIAALAVAWWVDRRQLSQTIENKNVELRELRVEWDVERATIYAQAVAEAARVQAALDSMLGSQAPAPNPPKDYRHFGQTVSLPTRR